MLRIELINADGKSEKMQALYHLSGSISILEPGEYQLQIEDSNGGLVAEDTFTVQ